MKRQIKATTEVPIAQIELFSINCLRKTINEKTVYCTK